jgi:hypothetical protein
MCFIRESEISFVMYGYISKVDGEAVLAVQLTAEDLNLTLLDIEIGSVSYVYMSSDIPIKVRIGDWLIIDSEGKEKTLEDSVFKECFFFATDQELACSGKSLEYGEDQ